LGFGRILVPHDGSIPSQKAVEKAIELSKMSKDSHIIFLHVIPELVIPPMIDRPIRSRKTGEITTMGECYQEMVEEMTDSALKMLERWKVQCETDGISVETKSAIGSPGDVILNEAKKENVEVIVMGSTGLRGISKIRALGSVARRVSEEAECPVLLIR
jgi:nucleotide-binding universal stress UspA family protein